MHAFIRGYKDLAEAGYEYDDNDKTWKVKAKNGGPGGSDLPVNKNSPGVTDVHVDKPLGSVKYGQGNKEDKKDDPGSQDIDPEQRSLHGDDIQNPDHRKNKKSKDNKYDSGTQDVDPNADDIKKR